MAALSYWMGYHARGRLSESDALALLLAELAFMPACVAALGFAGWRLGAGWWLEAVCCWQG